MEAFILITLVVTYFAIKGWHTISDSITQMRVQKKMNKIREANLAASRRLWAE